MKTGPRARTGAFRVPAAIGLIRFDRIPEIGEVADSLQGSWRGRWDLLRCNGKPANDKQARHQKSDRRAQNRARVRHSIRHSKRLGRRLAVLCPYHVMPFLAGACRLLSGASSADIKDSDTEPRCGTPTTNFELEVKPN